MLNTLKKVIPKPLFGLYHYLLGLSGNTIYRFPSHKLHVIGVTGTKGKTTTCYFAYQLLQKCAGKTALVSTTFFAIGKDFEANITKMGMPGRFFLPRFLNRAYKKGSKYAVVETTSEGILQHRQRFIQYNTAVFTGLSPEHIEHHGSFEAYRNAKTKLFRQCPGVHILNLNDKHAEYFSKYPAQQKWGIVLDKKIPPNSFTNILEGITAPPNLLKINEWELSKNKKQKLVAKSSVVLPSPGKFNGLNLLMAMAAARSAGVPFAKLVRTVPAIKLPPGRMQELKGTGIPYKIFLDYAHEPLSLKSALIACRELLPKENKLICLTGAQGGGRDKWKRKVMGATAGKYCDFVIVGTEDPYQEDPDKINQAVLSGVLSNKKFRENKNCWKFSDRRDAIRKALSLAKSDDIVFLAGKGGESLMCVGNKKIPWDEEGEVKKAILSSKI